MRIFLCGDVMAGRGIDQIRRHHVDPTLYESWAKSAVRYVELAEQRNGPIPRDVDGAYVWGDALDVLEEARADVRIVNLETAVTDHGAPWPAKGIHYRMHPVNVDLLQTAAVDCCVLSNNHVLDWSHDGLTSTLTSLREAGMATVGAGRDLTEARRPAMVETGTGPRAVVVGVGAASSGIPGSWSASVDRAGVWRIDSPDSEAVEAIATALADLARPGDVTILSIHWGPNWGFQIPDRHRFFARALIDRAGVDVVHGHSSHHPLAIEIYRNRPILYGCGDLINDYEGIGGHDEFRPGLGALYLLTMGPDGLTELEVVPMRLRRFRLERADGDDVDWLADTLADAGSRHGVSLESRNGRLSARW